MTSVKEQILSKLNETQDLNEESSHSGIFIGGLPDRISNSIIKAFQKHNIKFKYPDQDATSIEVPDQIQRWGTLTSTVSGNELILNYKLHKISIKPGNVMGSESIATVLMCLSSIGIITGVSNNITS